jgi:N-acetylglucosaminyldiphosphoundecaprenol N-acetyl-beta-D-mannosaminyltransferase
MPAATVNILGLPVGAYTMTILLARLQELLAAPGCAAAFGVNASVLNLIYRHPDYLEGLRRADCLYADGASLRLAARVLGTRIPEKLTTTDLWPHLCELAVQKDYRFFLLGGEPGLAARARDMARQRYPQLQIVGVYPGYFEVDDDAVVAAINAARPDILWVGMGDPRQVVWTDKWRRHLQVSLVLTCGGMFKIVAGELTRLPEPWRRRGWEWLYRLWQEPRTWRRYLLGLPLFGLRVLGQRFLGSKVFPARPRP